MGQMHGSICAHEGSQMARADGLADFDIEPSLHLHLRRADLFLSLEPLAGGDLSLEQLSDLGPVSPGLLDPVLSCLK